MECRRREAVYIAAYINGRRGQFANILAAAAHCDLKEEECTTVEIF
jgi:hypothetical protein